MDSNIRDSFNFERRDKAYLNGYCALELASQIPDTPSPTPFNIHCYWRVPLPFERKQAAAIKSLVVTQHNATIYLWSNVDLSDNDWVKPLLPYIQLKIYDPVKEAIGTPLEGFDKLTTDDDLCYPGGDLFRSLITYKYGGLYVDMDVLTLRDYGPLMCVEFMFQWGTELNQISGAVMHIRKGSQLGVDLLEEIRKHNPGPHSMAWGTHTFTQVRKKNQSHIIFPCAFFSPEWQLYINMSDEDSGHPFFWGEYSHLDFPGSFAWHYFNKWDSPIHPESKFARLESRINDRFNHTILQRA